MTSRPRRSGGDSDPPVRRGLVPAAPRTLEPGGPGGRRRTLPLSRDRVVSAAIALIDERGARSLTMAGVGERLGVEAMSLYRYVHGREHLLDAIVGSVLGELEGDQVLGPGRSPADWRTYLGRLAHGVRDIALAHPQVFPLVATRPPEAPWMRPPLRSLAWVESFLDTLLSHGFSDDGAVAAYRAYSSFLLGHLLLEVSSLGADVGPLPPPHLQSVREAGPPLLDGFPQVARLQHRLAADHSTAEFQSSLDNLLDRLALLRPAGRP